MFLILVIIIRINLGINPSQKILMKKIKIKSRRIILLQIKESRKGGNLTLGLIRSHLLRRKNWSKDPMGGGESLSLINRSVVTQESHLLKTNTQTRILNPFTHHLIFHNLYQKSSPLSLNSLNPSKECQLKPL